MKKYIISILMFIITILSIILIINKPSEELSTTKSIYNLETRNYINNSYYSSIIEKYEISNNEYIYTKEIIYNNGEKQTNSIEGYYIIEDNKLLLDNKHTLYLIEDKLCLDNTCNISYTKNSTIIDNHIDNFDPKDHLIYLNNISFLKDDNSFKYIVFIKDNCTECVNYINILTEIVQEYNIDIHIINISNLNNNDYNTLIEQYNISNYPTTIIYINNKEEKRFNIEDKSSIINNLFTYNINSR